MVISTKPGCFIAGADIRYRVNNGGRERGRDSKYLARSIKRNYFLFFCSWLDKAGSEEAVSEVNDRSSQFILGL